MYIRVLYFPGLQSHPFFVLAFVFPACKVFIIAIFITCVVSINYVTFLGIIFFGLTHLNNHEISFIT